MNGGHEARAALRRRAAGICGCGVAVLLPILGCRSSTPETIGVGNADDGRTVMAHVGDRIEATLQTIGPGQYGTPVLSSASVVFLDESAAGEPNPGGPRQLYRFEAVASGRASLTIPHTGDPPGRPVTPTFNLTVEVQ